MDAKDRAIAAALSDDSRAPLRAIAKKTKLRPSTVHARIRKLKEDGTIRKFTVVLDDKKTGQNFLVFLLVKTRPAVLLDVSSRHIVEVHGVTGEYDLLLKLKFRDIEEFNQFLIAFRAQENIVNTLTMIGTAVVKQGY